MSLRVPIIFALAAFAVAACAGKSEAKSSAAGAFAPPRDFGEVTLQAFDRHPNLRKVPEGFVQDSMFGCALSWKSDHATPEPQRLVNAARAYDLMAEGNWKEIDPYCRLGALKNYLP